MEGSLFLVVLLMILLGLTGMSFGLVVSSFARNEVEALQLAMAAFFPSFLLSGIIWPLQAAPVVRCRVDMCVSERVALCMCCQGVSQWSIVFM